jgi:hypothetical protein
MDSALRASLWLFKIIPDDFVAGMTTILDMANKKKKGRSEYFLIRKKQGIDLVFPSIKMGQTP